MTALIYKAALPTYTSAEAMNADAGESLLLNEAGTGYELLPTQGGDGYVPGTDWLYVECDWNNSQAFVAQASPAATTLTFDTPLSQGSAFAVGTKSIHVLEGTRVRGLVIISAYEQPAAIASLLVSLWQYTGDTTGTVVGNAQITAISFPPLVFHPAPAWTPFFEIPFELAVTPGVWLRVKATAAASDLVLDQLGGMFIERIA